MADEQREQPLMFDLIDQQGSLRADWLGLATDNRRLFDGLQDGWLAPPPLHLGSLVGVNGYLCEDHQPDGNRIPVRIRLDAARLPDVHVFALRDNCWQRMLLADVVATDGAVFWPGSLPLFSITNVCVSTNEQRVRLLSIGKRVSNVDLPEVSVASFDRDNVAFRSIPDPEIHADHGCPERPEIHDAVRGAISMALWAVPRIDPWLDVLTESLSARPRRLSEVAGAVNASWWRFPPWAVGRTADARDAQERLWLAASEVFATAGCHGESETVDRVAMIAGRDSGDDVRIIEEWRLITHRVLRAEELIGYDNWRQQPVGLSIQLVLSRPEPTAFKTWFDDAHVDLPPAVAWSAAALCGVLHGYRKLDTRFRGKTVQREVVAVQSLRMCTDGSSLRWPGVSHDPPKWESRAGNFTLSWGGREFACKPGQARAKWYAADFGNDLVRQGALALAKENAWPCRRRVVSLADGRRRVSGSGSMKFGEGTLGTRGDVRIQLLPQDNVADDLEVDEFRRLVAVEPGRFIAPPVSERGHEPSDEPARVPGLRMIPDFLTETEEEAVLREIDHSTWSNELQRRVQHYGWRYDYKSRQIDPSMRLGPLPGWATKIAQRLVDDGYFPDACPDQVIVNEYCGSQGITPHIDSPASFTDVVAMISLLESWEMDFRKRSDKTKVVLCLPRRSATILRDDARYEWTHEIPKRKTEPGPVKPGKSKPSRVSRGRRISLTFRKVVDPAETVSSTGSQRRTDA